MRISADKLKSFFYNTLSSFPWRIIVKDWTGQSYSVGGDEPHWHARPLEMDIKTERAGADLLAMRPMKFLDRFLSGEVDMRGNLYLLSHIRQYAKMSLSIPQMLLSVLSSRAFLLQDTKRAKTNVKSHYDIPQEVLDTYLDQTYMSYSCAMFEHPDDFDVDEMLRPGRGKQDNFDSLEKAQWRKFADAMEFLDPKRGETVVDIGCGYGGQLAVALESTPASRVVGWTHSANQVRGGRRMLAEFDEGRWELNEGDYRLENRQFDHVASTGMVSHVGPRGLVPYVRNIRKLIRDGGRYVHHALMAPYTGRSLDSDIGIAFNKKYVWPGFHWFTYAQHTKALEENGFEVVRSTNLSQHYAKTTAAWYERMMQKKGVMVSHMGEATLRAWQIYLSGASGGFTNGEMHVYRLYCRAR